MRIYFCLIFYFCCFSSLVCQKKAKTKKPKTIENPKNKIDYKFDYNKLRDPDRKGCYGGTADFHYFGNKSEAVDNSKCIRWLSVTKWIKHQFRGYQLYYFADEFTEHNHCRNIDLTIYTPNPKLSNASAHLFLGYDEQIAKGPWCYVEKVYGSNLFGNLEFRKGAMPEHLTAKWKGYHLTEPNPKDNNRNTTRFIHKINQLKMKYEPKPCFKMCK
ncbi:hypothetical protein niasHT_028655 [Heterodera trifolii]|uniref:Kringle-like domain-containing protein n=1 Tax=Heterodera trifolii TaxID=157864 RepID=A0ABD2K0K3_9BILA